MSPTITGLNTSTETSQEGTAPVQSFTSSVIPVLPGAAVAPRLGRPTRTRVEPRQEEKIVDGAWPSQDYLVGQLRENE